MINWKTTTRELEDYIIQVCHGSKVVRIKKKRPRTFLEKFYIDRWTPLYKEIFAGHITQLTFLANTASDLLNYEDGK
jgi:hypothetical protein